MPAGTEPDGVVVCITGGVSCRVLAASVTFPPLSPPRTAPWVYTSARGRLDATAPIQTTPDGTPVNLEPLSPATPGLLRLYQLDCNCSSSIRLVKSGGNVRLMF